MKINLTLTNEEIQAVNESALEITEDLVFIDEPIPELMENGDVIDTGAIKIARIDNQVTIDIESKFIFWCLKFATKIGKVCKFVYEMFSDLFEDLSDGYFKDEVERYNILENKEEESFINKDAILDVLANTKCRLKEIKVNLVNDEIRTEFVYSLDQLVRYMRQDEASTWPEAIELLERIIEKINTRGGVDPTLWEELYSNIEVFILDHKD